MQFQSIRVDKLKINQAQLAELLETTQPTVSRYESGKRPIPGPVAKLMQIHSEIKLPKKARKLAK